MVDYPCGNKFGDCSLSRISSVVRTDRHTERQTQMNA